MRWELSPRIVQFFEMMNGDKNYFSNYSLKCSLFIILNSLVKLIGKNHVLHDFIIPTLFPLSHTLHLSLFILQMLASRMMTVVLSRRTLYVPSRCRQLWLTIEVGRIALLHSFTWVHYWLHLIILHVCYLFYFFND